MRQSEKDMTEQIFAATERLMAEGGLHNLSMHKIAKEAQISAGTIYIYFKNKDELLKQFAYRVFSLFSQVLEENSDTQLPYFEQYRRMWWNIWSFLKNNPMIVINLNQYQSLPHFREIAQQCEHEGYWNDFCHRAVVEGVLCDLPSKILFSLSLECALNLALNERFFQHQLSDEILEDVIVHTWRAIQK